MGTNHYLVYPEQVDVECRCCGHVKTEHKKLHLGKSSCGWVYSLHIYPHDKDFPISSLDDMLSKISDVVEKGGWIENEYEEKLTKDEWLKIVKDCSHPIPIEEREKIAGSKWQYHARYKNPHGPNNLYRHHIDGFCIGYGEGTWDLFVGDFS